MYVYILYSRSLNKYYVGQTKDLINRLARHNKGSESYTKKGVPWILIWSNELVDRSSAMMLEKKIKKRGIQRFLVDFESLNSK